MLANIDWLSFTSFIGEQKGRGTSETLLQIQDALDDISPELIPLLGMHGECINGHGRAPYALSVSWHDGGVRLFYHPALPHFLVEVSGKGCEYLKLNGHTEAVLAHVQERLTRVDLACDMLCDVNPLEFVSQRLEKRFKAHSEVVSESGTTCYVGSRSSNRYARVYRYNPPHPRAHLLRVEYVMKAEDAKESARALISEGAMAVATSFGEMFGWQHSAWNTEGENAAEIQAFRPERKNGKTVFWLSDTVAPLLVRLHNDNDLDVYEWFSENVVRKLKPPSDNDGRDDDFGFAFSDIPF